MYIPSQKHVTCFIIIVLKHYLKKRISNISSFTSELHKYKSSIIIMFIYYNHKHIYPLIVKVERQVIILKITFVICEYFLFETALRDELIFFFDLVYKINEK